MNIPLEAEDVTEKVGVKVTMSRHHAYGLVNTAERLGELLDAGKLPEHMNNEQSRLEIEAFFEVSRIIGSRLH